MEIPRNIGRYDIRGEIGRGAMGVVYLAHDPKIDRRVAIKTVFKLDALPADEAEEMRRRFSREAQAAGRLQHPGIVTIFDVGEHETGYFIAMEYIEGETLEAYTKKENLLPVDAVVDLLAQAGEALDYAHQQHVVHRDIKPANLMLVKDNKLKITDFGLAKNPTTSLTQEGILLGTPNYMSPEQVTGKPVDGRSDLFSLGAVLYEMLTGERPFAGETVTTIMYRIVHESPAELRSFNAAIPPVIGRVVLRALEKEPARRFQTGAEFSRALRARATMTMAAGVGGSRSAPTGMPARAVQGATTQVAQAVSHAGVQPATAVAAAPAHVAPRAGWYERVRAVAILLGALGVVLLTPGAGTVQDRWGRGHAEGVPPFYRAAAIVAGGGVTTEPRSPSQAGASQLPQVAAIALPGPGPERVTITLQTSPPGGRIYLDDIEAASGVVHLPADDHAAHSVVAENDCYIEKISYRLKHPARDETVTVPLKTPKSARVQVRSRPQGARILVDGKEIGLITPAEVAVTACDSHSVALKLEGYKDVAANLGKDGSPMDVTLSRIPEGWITIASSYPVEVLEAGRKIGSGGEAIKLASGSHTLMVRNETLFVEAKVSVTVQAGKKISSKAPLPAVGALTVLASPSNCTISVNGREIGAPPINDYQLAEGTYVVRAVYVPTGEAKESSVTITAGGSSRIPFKFNL